MSGFKYHHHLASLGDYYKRGLSWEQFEQEYLNYIRQPSVSVEVQKLAQRSSDCVITLLCIEESPVYCHHRLLAEKCKRYQPKLILSIN